MSSSRKWLLSFSQQAYPKDNLLGLLWQQAKNIKVHRAEKYIKHTLTYCCRFKNGKVVASALVNGCELGHYLTTSFTDTVYRAKPNAL